MQFDRDLQSPNAALFQAARNLLLKTDGIVETKKPRITTYSDANGGICHLRTMPHGVDIGFLKGAKMQDQHGLLIGQGKAMRVLPMTSMNQSVLKYYLAQAIALNKSHSR